MLALSLTRIEKEYFFGSLLGVMFVVVSGEP